MMFRKGEGPCSPQAPLPLWRHKVPEAHGLAVMHGKVFMTGCQAVPVDDQVVYMSTHEVAHSRQSDNSRKPSEPLYARPAGSYRPAVSTPTTDEGADAGTHPPLPGPQAPAASTAMRPWVPEGERTERGGLEPYRPSPYEEVKASGLPSVPQAADLSPGHLPAIWPVLCFAVTFLVYVALVPHFILYSSPPTGDQPFYLMDTRSLVQDGDLELFNNYANRDEDKFYALAPRPPGFVGMTAPYPLPPQLTESKARPENEWYAAHLPGLSVALVPAWVVGSWFQLWWPATVVFMCLIGALLVTNIFLFAYELTGKLWVAIAVWLPVAFSNPVMSYSYLLFTELPTGLLLIYAFRRLALGWGANGRVRLLLTGAAIAYIPWLAWRCVPIAAALALYALVQWWRWHRRGEQGQLEPDGASGAHPSSRHLRSSFRSLLLVFAPMIVSGGLVVWYSMFLFGTLVPVGGGSLVRGQPAIFHWPWAGQSELQRYLMGAFGLLFDRQFGLLTYAPIYLLSVVGMIAMGRSARSADRRLLLWMAAISLPYLAVIAAFEWWHGVWCPPARYMTTFVPLLAGPLAMSLFALRHSLMYKLMYGLLALPGLVLMGIMMYDARMLWPGNEVLGWLADSPQSPVHIDLRGLLPYFVPPDDVRLPIKSGWVLSASVMIIVIAYLLMLRGTTVLGERRLPRGAQGLVWLGTLGVVGLGWMMMNLDYIKHRTTLSPQAIWHISPAPAEPHGMAYVDGKIYIADYVGQSVIVFDPTTGTHSYLVPVTEQGQGGSYAHPGDVKAGPDGLLYVLNNGAGDQALLVMRPDGTLVRGIHLNGKSPIAISLAFDRQGNIYIGDRQGGRVLKYGPDGGEPLQTFSGATGGFNNTGGVAVDEQGNVYVSDIGSQLVHHMAPDGSFIRKFDLPCQPWYIAINGDWLDVTCDRGMVSINRQSGHIQLALIEDYPSTLTSPTGLAYGAEGILYVVDKGTLYAFKVKH